MGGRSRAAAQILSGKGFKEVFNLKGGIKAWQGLKVAGPPEMGMEFLTGQETLLDLIVIAYSMEKGLKEFYEEMGHGTQDQKLVKLLNNLARVEQVHMDRLFELSKQMEPEAPDRDVIEKHTRSGLIEGGFSVEQILNQREDSLKEMDDIISMAMMIEAQGLDLYMRYSQILEDQQGEKIFHDLAQEEKGHLESLGRLMDQIA